MEWESVPLLNQMDCTYWLRCIQKLRTFQRDQFTYLYLLYVFLISLIKVKGYHFNFIDILDGSGKTVRACYVFCSENQYLRIVCGLMFFHASLF